MSQWILFWIYLLYAPIVYTQLAHTKLWQKVNLTSVALMHPLKMIELHAYITKIRTTYAE